MLRYFSKHENFLEKKRIYLKLCFKLKILFFTLSVFIFSIASTPGTCMLCVVVFQICCHFCAKRLLSWLPIFLILLSNDIHLNPGPEYTNNFFNFMTWNLNSMAKDNFQRVSLIEAHNYIYNY